MQLKEWKQTVKAGLIKCVNRMPVTSLSIGSPRKIAYVNNEDFEKTIVNEKVPVTEKPPGTIDKDVFFKFPPLYKRTQPQQYILKLQHARVWGNNGAILDSHDRFIADVSKEFGPAKFDPARHSVFNRIKLKKPVRFNGTIAVIASPGSNVYAHWFCDVLPRLVLLQKSGLLEKVDKILLNYSQLDFQKESLAKMSIPKEKLLNCIDDINFHLIADTLYVPSYPNEHGTVNPWVCDEIKNIFGTSDLKEPNNKSRRLYISRSKAKGRVVVNEDEIFNFLETEFGFTRLFTEDLSMPEKVRLFQHAECIVAPHGGGITNILFCKPGCKIVDIFPPGDFDTFFWSISNSNDLKYYYFFGKGDMPTPENDFMKRNSDIEVEMDKFKDLMVLLKLQ